jgi:hypothetical protein
VTTHRVGPCHDASATVRAPASNGIDFLEEAEQRAVITTLG